MPIRLCVDTNCSLLTYANPFQGLRRLHTPPHAWTGHRIPHLHSSSKTQKCRGRCIKISAATFSPQLVFSAVTLAVMPLYGLMVACPRKHLTKSVVSSSLCYTAGSLLYLAALVAWGSEGLLGNIWGAAVQSLKDRQVTAFAALFQNSQVTALTWTHLLLLDLCVARHVYLDGLKKQVFTAHSIILCFMFGPTGLLSHMFTQKFTLKQQRTSVVVQGNTV